MIIRKIMSLLYVVTAALFSFQMPAHSQELASVKFDVGYIDTAKIGCRVQHAPDQKLLNVDLTKLQWDGKCDRGYIQGFGTLTPANQSVVSKVVGFFDSGILTGMCVIYFDNGEKYEGECENLTMNGNGNYYYQSGHIYSGFFKRGFQSGFGTLRFSNGTRYEGQFNSGKIQGFGTLYTKNGSYTGKFVDGQRNGIFEYKGLDGRSITKIFLNDKPSKFGPTNGPEGFIKIYNTNGRCAMYTKGMITSFEWTGKCEDGLAEGHGKITFKLNDNLVGVSSASFIKGMLHGNATSNYDGVVIDKNYIKGEVIRSVVSDTTNNVVSTSSLNYDGNWICDIIKGSIYSYHGSCILIGVSQIYTGHGIETLKNGDRFEGGFNDLLRNGFGIFYSHSGYTYEVNWKNSIPDGPGKIKTVDGRVIPLRYDNGKLIINGNDENGNPYESEMILKAMERIGRFS